METETKKAITVETIVTAPITKVWNAWNNPEDIKNWCFASEDWHTPYSENDLQVNGRLKSTMAAKDGSFSFDFEGIYTRVEEPEVLEYTLLDDRKVKVSFIDEGEKTRVIETFEMEGSNSEEMQRAGWQAILDNFKKYVEGQR